MANPNIPSFPYAAPTDLILTVASDNAHTTLNGALTNNATTIAVIDASRFTIPCLIAIDAEIVRVRNKSGNNLTSCDRGFIGSPTTHSDATDVFGYILSYHHNQTSAEVAAMGSVLFNQDFSGLKKNENLLIFSEAFDNVVWIKTSGSTISANNGTSPTGLSTACTLLEGSTPGVNGISLLPQSLVNGSTYTFTVYAKYTNSQWLTIGQNVANDTTRRVSFDIQNGVVGTQGGIATGAIVSVGNGWYRCIVVTTSTSAANKTFDIALSNADNVVSYLGTTTSTAQIWGAQVRLGSLDGPLTYIRTSGASVSFTGSGDLILDEGDLT
jgi:hypothetical protein